MGGSGKKMRVISQTFICDILRSLVPFLQLKKCKKHPWRSVTFSKVSLQLY